MALPQCRLAARRSRCKRSTAASAADESLPTTFSVRTVVRVSRWPGLVRARQSGPPARQLNWWSREQLSWTHLLSYRKITICWDAPIHTRTFFLRLIFPDSIPKLKSLAVTRGSGVKGKHFSLRIWGQLTEQ